MSGHSKWSTIRRKKSAVDSKRGKIFTRLLREIQVAAKEKGSNPEGNPRLKQAIIAARIQSVPNDKIEMAVKRGAGEVEGVEYEDVTYEGYGPGGVAILIKALTDNKNRTVAEVRHALGRHGGSMAGVNAVAYLFQDWGVLTLPKEGNSEESLMELALEAGAADLQSDDENWEILCGLAEFENVKQALTEVGIEYAMEIRAIPDVSVPISGNDAAVLLRLLDALDDLDDVQKVVANFDIDEAELEQLSS